MLASFLFVHPWRVSWSV